MPSLAGKSGHALAIAVLLLLPFIFFWEMTVDGKEPLSADTQAARALGVWAERERAEMQELPLWCPMIFSGMPSYGSFIYTPSSPFDLMHWLRHPFSANRGMRYYISLLVGALAAYLLLLLRRMTPLPALAGALAFVMTPYFLGVIAAGHSTKLQALYLAPLVFLACEVLLRRRTLPAAAFLAGAVALQLWANHPQISYYTLLLSGAYVLFTLILEPPGAWRGRGLAMGVGLAAIALLLAAGLVLEPYAAVLEYTPYSIRGEAESMTTLAESAGGGHWAFATAWSYPPQELLSFLFPAWFGLEGALYWGDLPFTQSTHYLGITVLLLALIGVALTAGRRKWILVGIGLAVLLIGFGRYFPVLYGPMYKLFPMFSHFRIPSMIYSLLPLPVGLLCAEGVQRMIDGGAWQRAPRSPRKHAPAVRAGWGMSLLRLWQPLTIACAAVLVLWLLLGGAFVGAAGRAGSLVRPGEASRYGADTLARLVAERQGLLRGSVTVGLTLLTLGMAIVEGRRRRMLSGTLSAVLLVALMVCDLWVIDRRFYDPQPRRANEAALQSDEVVNFLKSCKPPFRIAPLSGGEMRSDRYAALGLESVGGYQTARLRIYDDLIRGEALLTAPVLSMLNVRYLISDRSLAAAGFPLARTVRGEEGPLYIHENPQALPRAWFVSAMQAAPDAKTLLAALQAPDFDPARTAWVYATETGAIPERLSGGEVLQLEMHPHELRLSVRVAGPDPGLLVLSEIFYKPGWVATLDGRPTGVLRANHVLRALLVPPGEHAIRLEAVSRGLSRGRTVSRIAALGLFALLVAGVAPRIIARRRAPAASAP